MTGAPPARHGHGKPSDWVQRFLGGVVPGGRVLDVACGAGRHARLALGRGFRLTAIDRTLAGVADLRDSPGVELIEADLEAGAPFPAPGRTFDGVIVTNYLWRPIIPDIVAAVAPSGVLIYETFAQGNERLGRPSNPDFLLFPGELIEAVRGTLTPIAFECLTLQAPPRVVQRIAAVGPDHPWRRDPPGIDCLNAAPQESAKPQDYLTGPSSPRADASGRSRRS